MTQQWPKDGAVQTIVDKANTSGTNQSEMVESLTQLSHKDVTMTAAYPIKGKPAVDAYFEGKLYTTLEGLWVKVGSLDGQGKVEIDQGEWKPLTELEAREEIRLALEAEKDSASRLGGLAAAVSAIKLLFTF